MGSHFGLPWVLGFVLVGLGLTLAGVGTARAGDFRGEVEISVRSSGVDSVEEGETGTLRFTYHDDAVRTSQVTAQGNDGLVRTSLIFDGALRQGTLEIGDFVRTYSYIPPTPRRPFARGTSLRLTDGVSGDLFDSLSLAFGSVGFEFFSLPLRGPRDLFDSSLTTLSDIDFATLSPGFGTYRGDGQITFTTGPLEVSEVPEARGNLLVLLAVAIRAAMRVRTNRCRP